MGEIDETLVAFFLSELANQTQVLKKSLEILHVESQFEGEQSHFIQTIQAIKQAAQIIQIQTVNQICSAIEEYFTALKSQNLKWNGEGEQIINEILELFQKISSISPKEIDFFIQQQSNFLNHSTQRLHELVTSKASFSLLQESVVENSSSIPKEGVIDSTMFELFKIELETQCKILNQGLIEFEQKTPNQKLLESLMRAAHSVKGAARVVSLTSIVRLAHAMEDCFVAVQNQKAILQTEQVNELLNSVDLLARLSKLNLNEITSWIEEQLPLIEALIQRIRPPFIKITNEKIENHLKNVGSQEASSHPFEVENKNSRGSKNREIKKAFQASLAQDRVLRITAQNLNHLMGLAGEYLVESRWLSPFGDHLQLLKTDLNNITNSLNLLTDHVRKERLNEIAQHCLEDLHLRLNETRDHLSKRLEELDNFIRRHASLSDRLYQEVINSRMRPFSDGVEGFPRMVRDLAYQLGKQVKFEIEGRATLVDRDILEKLESPLAHLLRNAIDHGIETPEERQAMGKPIEGMIKLKAHHKGGMLAITVSDDGRGVNISKVREKIVSQQLVSEEIANHLTDSEIINFLFLPGFSTSDYVTEISGRGVGLNVVQDTIQEIGGLVTTSFTPQKGMSFHLQLPLTLSVIRALLVEMTGEVYAFPLVHIDQAFLVNCENIQLKENGQFFYHEGEQINLILAWQLLDLNEPSFNLQHVPVIVVSDHGKKYGIIVDRLIGEKELVVQELDPRLGKIPDISAGALLEDGTPALIIDVEDILLSIDHILRRKKVPKEISFRKSEISEPRKRILIVDDSITVREVECHLLQKQGYEVETAINGIDGWNAVRIGHYDLVITDIDMPRMNGIELLHAIKGDPKLQNLPVIIVSYKEGDRIQGLEAGANYYLTKSSFHDATFIAAVKDLIGTP